MASPRTPRKHHHTHAPETVAPAAPVDAPEDEATPETVTEAATDAAPEAAAAPEPAKKSGILDSLFGSRSKKKKEDADIGLQAQALMDRFQSLHLDTTLANIQPEQLAKKSKDDNEALLIELRQLEPELDSINTDTDNFIRTQLKWEPEQAHVHFNHSYNNAPNAKRVFKNEDDYMAFAGFFRAMKSAWNAVKSAWQHIADALKSKAAKHHKHTHRTHKKPVDANVAANPADPNPPAAGAAPAEDPPVSPGRHHHHHHGDAQANTTAWLTPALGRFAAKQYTAGVHMPCGHESESKLVKILKGGDAIADKQQSVHQYIDAHKDAKNNSLRGILQSVQQAATNKQDWLTQDSIDHLLSLQHKKSCAMFLRKTNSGAQRLLTFLREANSPEEKQIAAQAYINRSQQRKHSDFLVRQLKAIQSAHEINKAKAAPKKHRHAH